MRWNTRRRVTTSLGLTMVIVSVSSTGYEAAQDTDNAFTSRVDATFEEADAVVIADNISIGA